jgi:UDP-GlcNAc:undecaprenyl-phosphate GlcNAc-1-phosphate transferase
VAFAVTLLLTPWSKKLSNRLGAIDYPRKRGMHKTPIPRMGGAAIVAGFLVTMAVLYPFVPEFHSFRFAGFAAGAVIIALIGAIDDIRHSKGGLRARYKLMAQILAASIIVITGTRIRFISLLSLPIADFLNVVDIPLTIIWIVGVTNAFNLIDGLDGLTAGISSISGVFLTALCIMSGTPIAVVFAAAIAGSCLGFLPRNFSPAEVIMGDTGAMFLGFTLAVSSILGLFKEYALISVIIAVLVMALPIFDTLFAIVRRVSKGKPIMSADRGHLHHRLVDAGLSPKKAVVTLYLISVLTAVAAVLLALQDVRVAIISGVTLIIASMMAYVYYKRLGERKRAEEEREKKSDEGERAGYELDEKK